MLFYHKVNCKKKSKKTTKSLFIESNGLVYSLPGLPACWLAGLPSLPKAEFKMMLVMPMDFALKKSITFQEFSSSKNNHQVDIVKLVSNYLLSDIIITIPL